MAVFRRIQAIKIWFFCIWVKLYYLPDTTMAYKFCNGIKIPHWSACSHDVDCIINDLAKEMTSNGDSSSYGVGPSMVWLCSL